MHDNRMTATERRATVGLGAVFALRMFGMFIGARGKPRRSGRG